MKNRLSIVSVLIFLSHCSSFSPYAKHNQFGTEDGRIKIYNEKLNFKSLNFGDFKFAGSEKEFKQINSGKKPEFKSILLYAKTEWPEYEYYILNDEIHLKSVELKSYVINLNNG